MQVPVLLFMKNNGFTFVELIVTILIVGILSAYIAPRFFSANTFEQRATSDEIISAIRRAQQLSMTRGESYQFVLTASNYSVQKSDGTDIRHPDGTATSTKDFHDKNFSASPITIRFNSLGQPFDTSGNPLLATNIAIGAVTITIEQETGYAH